MRSARTTRRGPKLTPPSLSLHSAVSCARRLASAAVILLSCVGTVASAAPLAPAEGNGERTDAGGMTMRMDRRLGPYRIGMDRRIFESLIRTIRQPRNDGPGCSGSFLQDSYIDVYPGLRLGYLAFEGRTSLDTIATTRRGDRSSVGLTIGRSTRTDVRRHYPGFRVWRHRGGSTITVYRRTGYESHEYVEYGFDSSQRLVRLETGVGGC